MYRKRTREMNEWIVYVWFMLLLMALLYLDQLKVYRNEDWLFPDRCSNHLIVVCQSKVDLRLHRVKISTVHEELMCPNRADRAIDLLDEWKDFSRTQDLEILEHCPEILWEFSAWVFKEKAKWISQACLWLPSNWFSPLFGHIWEKFQWCNWDRYTGYGRHWII